MFFFFFRWNNSWDPGTSFFSFLLAQVPQETGPCLDGWTFTMHCTGFLGFAWRADGLASKQASKQAGGRADRQAAVEHFLEAFTTELYTEFMCSLTPSPQGRGSESLFSSV